MIKIYVMSTCPDCQDIKRMACGDDRFQVIDLGEHVHNLREFMRLRDTHPKFRVARERGLVGIPSFVLEDGTVTFKPAEAGLIIGTTAGASCSIDGSGC